MRLAATQVGDGGNPLSDGDVDQSINSALFVAAVLKGSQGQGKISSETWIPADNDLVWRVLILSNRS